MIEGVDSVTPVITLNGLSEITIYQNSVYTELGATAVDAIDGNIEVIITGIVDTSTINTYIITYSATDYSGNTSSIKRYVNVISASTQKTQLDVMAV